METAKKISRVRLGSVISYAMLAGLIAPDQYVKEIDEVEVRGDFANLLQFVELMYQDKEEDEFFEELMKKGLDDL